MNLVSTGLCIHIIALQYVTDIKVRMRVTPKLDSIVLLWHSDLSRALQFRANADCSYTIAHFILREIFSCANTIAQRYTH